MKEFLFIALVLACPLAMILMMRGGHGHGGHGHQGGHAGHGGGCHGGHGRDAEPDQTSTADLRRRRDELDRLIEERERSERWDQEPTPTVGTKS